ncbi:MAG TPA: tail fiber protein [Chloroflexota bacterium]|nr:tail fiber protein [Chloroflexota bacterium]
MAEPFIGEVKIIAWNFPPKGWAFCNGQLLPIYQNQALFSILGTTYGGDGRLTFALPNLQGRAPFHVGNGLVLGQQGGETAHTLTLSELPAHTHIAQCASANAALEPAAGNVWATTATTNRFSATPNSAMNPAAVGTVGGSQAHENMAPYLTLNFVIALQGIFPSQN